MEEKLHRRWVKIGGKKGSIFNGNFHPDIKKQLWEGHFWSDGGYIGTVGDGVTADIIKSYIEKQGTKEGKEGHGQMELLDF